MRLQPIWKFGRDLLAQVLVLDLTAQVTLGGELQRLHEDRRLGQADDLRLSHPVDAGAAQLLEAGEVLEREMLDLGVLAVRAGQDPRRGALVHVEVRDLLPIAGTIWMAEAPVPMTATRLPVRSASWFQRAEWKISPLKSSMPLMSGSEGSHSAPTAETTILATKSPLLVLTSTARRLVVPAGRENVAVEDVLVEHACTCRPPTGCTCWISGWVEKERVHSGLSANEYEYKCDGTSHAAPG